MIAAARPRAALPRLPRDLAPAAARRLIGALVGAAGWHNDARTLAEAQPHHTGRQDGDDLISSLRSLGVRISVGRARMADLAPEDLPCLFLSADAVPLALLERRGPDLLALAPEAEAAHWIRAGALRGRAVRVLAAEPGGAGRAAPPLFSLTTHLRRYGRLALGVAVATLLANILAFAAPLFVMALYDHVIPTRSGELLAALSIGLLAAFLFDIAFRMIRTRAVVHAGAVAEGALLLAFYRKLTALPLPALERSGITVHLARLKQFEALRDAFAGPVVSSLLDLPFALLFLAAVFHLAPDVGALIVALIAVFALVTVLFLPLQRRLNREASQARAARQALVMEIADHQKAIRRLGAADLWLARARPLSARNAAAARRARQLSLGLQSFGQAVMMLAGVTAVVHGARAAMAGEMSMGALIAVITLVWRVMAPFQAIFAAAAQIDGQVRTARQADLMLAQPEETMRGPGRTRQRRVQGALRFTGVSYRYEGAADPALAGISFEAPRDGILMIPGRNSSGKSTLLKLAAGLHRPGTGLISIGGADLRQIAADDLRGSMAMALQSAEFFHGTLRQNFALADPLADEARMLRALREAGFEEEARALPDGLDTRLTEAVRRSLPAAVLQGFSLARAYLRDAPMLILDEPCNGLDSDRDALFMDKLRAEHGRRMVIVVTNRPSHLRLADALLYLDAGRVAAAGSGELTLRKIAALDAAAAGETHLATPGVSGAGQGGRLASAERSEVGR